MTSESTSFWAKEFDTNFCKSGGKLFCRPSNTVVEHNRILNSIPLKRGWIIKNCMLLLNLAATHRNFIQIWLQLTATFCLLKSCGTATFSTKYRKYIVPLYIISHQHNMFTIHHSTSAHNNKLPNYDQLPWCYKSVEIYDF